MKAIKKSDAWWTFICGFCKSEIRAGLEDVKVNYAYGYKGYYVECLQCGEWEHVPKNKLTEKITKMAEEKIKKE